MTRIIAVADMIADMTAYLMDESVIVGEDVDHCDILNAVGRLEYILTEEDDDETG